MDWHTIHGDFTDADADALCGLLEEVPVNGTTAHVGILCGRHLAACSPIICERRLSVLAVDTWRGSDNGILTIGPEGKPQKLTELVDWTATAIAFGRVTALFGLDVDVRTRGSLYVAADCRHAGRKFDLIFLDADHSYEHVQADIMAWKPLLVPGGVLCGHDWGNADYPGVRRAAEELLPGAHLVGGQVWGWKADA